MVLYVAHDLTTQIPEICCVLVQLSEQDYDNINKCGIGCLYKYMCVNPSNTHFIKVTSYRRLQYTSI